MHQYFLTYQLGLFKLTLNNSWFVCKFLSCFCSKLRLSSKHIIMMTCTPDPHVNDLDQQGQAKRRASSLSDASVMLNVVPLGSSFDMKAFYSVRD